MGTRAFSSTNNPSREHHSRTEFCGRSWPQNSKQRSLSSAWSSTSRVSWTLASETGRPSRGLPMTQLSLLDVRLGHRRRLQRAIAKDRSSWPDNAPLPLAPDLNQRVQDWLHQETRSSFAMENLVPSAWPSQMPVATRNDPCAVTSEYQPPSSSDNSSSYTIRSIPKVLSGLKARRAPCLDLEDHRVGSKSLETL